MGAPMYTQTEATEIARLMGQHATAEQTGGSTYAVVVREGDVVVSVVAEGGAPELIVHTATTWADGGEPLEVETVPSMAGGALFDDEAGEYADPDVPGHDARWWAALGEMAAATARQNAEGLATAYTVRSLSVGEVIAERTFTGEAEHTAHAYFDSSVSRWQRTDLSAEVTVQMSDASGDVLAETTVTA